MTILLENLNMELMISEGISEALLKHRFSVFCKIGIDLESIDLKGASEMRIGLFLTILLFCLVALGYLISDSIQLHQDVQNLGIKLDQANQARERAELAMKQANEARVVAEQSFEQEVILRQVCEQSNLGLKADIESLSNTIGTLQYEKVLLNWKFQLLNLPSNRLVGVSLSSAGGLICILWFVYVVRGIRTIFQKPEKRPYYKYIRVSKEELDFLNEKRRAQYHWSSENWRKD